MPRADRCLALTLAALAAITRLPFRARLLSTWDAVQFALALGDYDITRHQPHPPGYLLYVGLGRLVASTGLTGRDDAYVWLSISASAAAVFALYRLAWTLYGRAAALVAAGGLLASPLFWFYGLVGLPYAVEAALATAVVGFAWPMQEGRVKTETWSALALGLAGGVRQSMLILLLPLWLGAAWGGLGRRRALVGLGVLGLTVLAWLLPMLWLAGGPGPYLLASRELYESTVRATTVTSFFGSLGPLDAVGAAGLVAWLRNLRGLLEAGLLGLGLFSPVLLAILAEAWRRRHHWGPRSWLFAGWLGPAAIVYAAVHFGQYGYLLTVLPALYLLVARQVVLRWGRGQGRSTVVLVAAVLLLHAVYFVTARPVDVFWDRQPAGPAGRLSDGLRAFYRLVLWPHTAHGLRDEELVLLSYVEAIRGGFDPGDSVVVTELGNPRSYPWFRQAAYYLPEFPIIHLRLDGFTSGYLASSCLTSMAARSGPDVPLPPSTRRLVWMVDAWSPWLPRPAGLETRALPYGRWLYVLAVGEPGVAHGGYRLARSPLFGCSRAGRARPGGPPAAEGRQPGSGAS
jgi:hypothetical protein